MCRRFHRTVKEVEWGVDMKRRPAEAAIALGFKFGPDPSVNANFATRVGQQFRYPLGNQRTFLDNARIRKIELVRLPSFRKRLLADFHLLNTQQHGYGRGTSNCSMSYRICM